MAVSPSPLKTPRRPALSPYGSRRQVGCRSSKSLRVCQFGFLFIYFYCYFIFFKSKAAGVYSISYRTQAAHSSDFHAMQCPQATANLNLCFTGHTALKLRPFSKLGVAPPVAPKVVQGYGAGPDPHRRRRRSTILKMVLRGPSVIHPSTKIQSPTSRRHINPTYRTR